MKIGILTLPLHTNYGGILQAYALQTVLERMGHEAEVIDRNRFRQLPLWGRPISYTKRFLKKIFVDRTTVIRQEKYAQAVEQATKRNTEQFVEKYIKRRVVESIDELKAVNTYDAYIVGSDQVWRPIYFHDVENAYLKFAVRQRVKRIAYAASFGIDKWEYDPGTTKNCRALVQQFDAVSVREQSAIKLCKEYLGVDAHWVLDPAFLLSANDYIQLINDSQTPCSPGSLLYYMLDETSEKMTLIDKIASEQGLTPFRVNSLVENKNAPLEQRIQPPVEQWLRGFYDADFVVTDSFHACVFSIIFQKQFLAIGNEKRGVARLSSLLDRLGIGSRMVTAQSIDATPQIDFTEVNLILDEARAKSMRFLADALYSNNRIGGKHS